MKTHALRLRPGDDLRQSLETFTRDRKLRAGCIASCVGSAAQAVIRCAGQTEAAAMEGPLEIVSLVGTLSPDGAHLHLSVSDGQGRTVGGHLARGTLVHTTAEIVVLELENLAFARELDPATGYRELVIRGAG
ncbi:MAG TPA: PPC domain-containing DNA-binding protein [Burkholderiales bacterium]|nr:PPC domain-containing DNA-binding protein [Burkholderiales bacterium]